MEVEKGELKGGSDAYARASMEMLWLAHFMSMSPPFKPGLSKRVSLFQDESSSHECNQRTILLYGVGKSVTRSQTSAEKITKDILKILNKKSNTKTEVKSPHAFAPICSLLSSALTVFIKVIRGMVSGVSSQMTVKLKYE